MINNQPEYRWERNNWISLAEGIRKNNVIVLLPVGSIEQHGPHLPIGLDTLIADYVCLKSSERLNSLGITTYKLPPIWYGLSSMWLAYTGTITLKSSTLAAIITDVIESLMHSGINHVVIVNGHAGNSDLLRVAARDISNKWNNLIIAVITLWDLVGDVISRDFETPFFHADEVETSIALALGLIDKPPNIEGAKPSRFRRYYTNEWHPLDLRLRPKVYVYRRESTERIGNGAFGKPNLANRLKGEKLISEMINRLVQFIKDEMISV